MKHYRIKFVYLKIKIEFHDKIDHHDRFINVDRADYAFTIR